MRKPQSIFIIQNTSTDKYIYLVHSQNHTDYYFGNQGEVLGTRSVYRNWKLSFDVLQVEDSKNRKLVKISLRDTTISKTVGNFKEWLPTYLNKNTNAETIW